MDISCIKQMVSNFREAIEKAYDAGDFDSESPMKRFPQGCCGDVAVLVGEYLVNKGIRNLWYVCGNHYPDTGDKEDDYEGFQSHAWISVGEPFDSKSLIVDITGDQFKFNSEYGNYSVPVYVGTIDDFHRLFEVENRDCHRFYGIEEYDQRVQERMYRLYDIIMSKV